MTAPEITAALEKLIDDTPPPVTMWGVRYTQTRLGTPAGDIVWLASEAEARKWLAGEHAAGYSAEIVRITGRLHVEG